MKLPYPYVAFALAALAVAACSGGGSTPSAPRTLATGSAAAATPAAAGGSARTRVTISFPPHGATSSFRRRSEFVSPAASGVDIFVYTHPQGANPTAVAHVPTDISQSSTACSADPGGTRTCVATLPINAGTYDFVFTLYDAAPVAGSFSAAKELGTGSVTQTIVRNADNSVSVAIDGVIASFALAPGRQTFAIGSPATLQLGVTPLDAADETILATSADPYLNPVTLSVADTGGHTLLELNGGTPAASVVSTQLSDRIAAVYDGLGPRGYTATVSASATNATGASELLDSYYVSSSRTDFTSYGATVAITADEPHATGPFSVASVACGGVATSSPVSGSGEVQSFTITAASSNGTCNYLVSNEDGSLTDRDFVDLYVPGPVPTGRLFVAGSGLGIFSEYALGTSTLSANVQNDAYTNMTTLKGAFGIARDASGFIYVTDYYSQTIDVFTPTVNDNMAPVRQIVGPATQLNGPRLVRVDGSGNVYVLSTANGNTITEYAAGSNGNVAPIRTITLGNLPGDTYRGFTLDASANMYAVSYVAAMPTAPGALYELSASAPSGPAAPIRTISGPDTMVAKPLGVAVGPSGNVYVTSDYYDNFSEFGPTQTGDAVPLFSSAEELNQPAGIVVEADGTVVTSGLTSNGAYYVTYPPGQQHASAQYGPIYADALFPDFAL